MDELLLFNKFFPIVDKCISCKDIAGKVVRRLPDGDFLAIFGSCIFSEPHAAHFTHAF